MTHLVSRVSFAHACHLLLGTALLALAACGDDSTASGEECLTDTLDAQPASRFPSGRTYYLPSIADSETCEGVQWRLADAPEDNANELVQGDDAFARFTPVVTGEYRFTLAGTNTERSVTVVDGQAQPFHNLNYFGTHTAARVGEQLWVADVYAPRLTRVDPTTLETAGSIATGGWPVAVAWREGMAEAVVAQRGDDTLGFVDVDSGRLVDAVWVGDEPTNVVVSPDGQRAYVALATEAAVAVVDIPGRAVLTRIETVPDPRAMAISADGRTLVVASHRSGQPVRATFGTDPVELERDLAIIDTETDSVAREVIDVGSTLTGLAISDDGGRIYVATQRNDTVISQVDPAGLSFQNLIVVLDSTSGDELLAVDLAKQDTSEGFATFPHQMAVAAGSLWVAVEASDLLLELDPETLAERSRVEAAGRPRGLVASDEAVWVHGAQGFAVTRVAGDDVRTAVVSQDPRPSRVAAGMAQFTGAGVEGFGDRSCNSCHTDGLGDTLVWQAGPFPAFFASRAQFWLPGTRRLGWDAYLSNTTNFAFGVSANVGRRLDTERTLDLSAYLDSVVPPPAANGWTSRDGALSEQAERGRALFEGEANCASCHPLPLTTNQLLLDVAITEGPADVPALVGAYRHGVWLKHGEALTLRDSVVQVANSLGTPLVDEQLDDLTQYLQQMTDRHFFVLASDPEAGDERVAPEAPLHVTFNVPVWDDADNLAHVMLQDAEGAAVETTMQLDGRELTVVPSAALQPGSDYALVFEDGLEALDERPLFAAARHEFTTAAPPSIRLEGQYSWTVQFPSIDFAALAFDYDNLLPTTATITATPTPSGASIAVDYGGGFVLESEAIIEGSTLYLPNLVIAVGGSGVDSTTMQATLIDDDDDGVADTASGLVGFSGPGMLGEGLDWVLERPTGGVCEPGSSGEVPVTITFDDEGMPVVNWEGEALGLYVTEPGASLPAGPNQPVTGGAVYWGLALEAFPTGFGGPTTYGEVPDGAVDATVELGGDAPGAAPLMPGQCVQFAVTTTDFQSGQVIVVLE